MPRLTSLTAMSLKNVDLGILLSFRIIRPMMNWTHQRSSHQGSEARISSTYSLHFCRFAHSDEHVTQQGIEPSSRDGILLVRDRADEILHVFLRKNLVVTDCVSRFLQEGVIPVFHPK